MGGPTGLAGRGRVGDDAAPSMTTSTLLALLFVAAAGLLVLRLVGRTLVLLLRLALLALLAAGLAVGLRGGGLPPLPAPAGPAAGYAPTGPGR